MRGEIYSVVISAQPVRGLLAPALDFFMIHPGTTASLICPACGQAFLTMQQSMAGVVQCPHCAHSAPRAEFDTQAQVVGVRQVRRRVAQMRPWQGGDMAPVSQLPTPDVRPWSVVDSVTVQPQANPLARTFLQPSQALMPVGGPPPVAEFTRPSHSAGSFWKRVFILLVFMIVCAVSAWFWWEQSPASDFVAAAPVTKPPVVPEIRLAQSATPAESRVATFPPPDVAAIAADVKALVTELIAADTAERRADCIHEAEKHGAEIEALFGAGAEEKIELRLLARIPGLPLVLPSGQPVPIFKVVTSRCANGALIRLESGADGKRRIHWPLFHETHEAKLVAFLKQSGEQAAWLHLGLRPSHGLDIPAALRPKYLTFDIQTSATSEPRFVACVERDTPLGRFLDRETDWGRAYLSRLLVRRLDIEADTPCMVVVDCEGAQQGAAGR
jgi:hypothetical protein